MAETNSSVRSDDCETTRHADQIFNLSFPPQAATFRLLVTTKRRGDEMPVFDKDLRFKKRCGGGYVLWAVREQANGFILNNPPDSEAWTDHLPVSSESISIYYHSSSIRKINARYYDADRFTMYDNSGEQSFKFPDPNDKYTQSFIVDIDSGVGFISSVIGQRYGSYMTHNFAFALSPREIIGDTFVLAIGIRKTEEKPRYPTLIRSAEATPHLKLALGGGFLESIAIPEGIKKIKVLYSELVIRPSSIYFPIADRNVEDENGPLRWSIDVWDQTKPRF